MILIADFIGELHLSLSLSLVESLLQDADIIRSREQNTTDTTKPKNICGISGSGRGSPDAIRCDAIGIGR